MRWILLLVVLVACVQELEPLPVRDIDNDPGIEQLTLPVDDVSAKQELRTLTEAADKNAFTIEYTITGHLIENQEGFTLYMENGAVRSDTQLFVEGTAIEARTFIWKDRTVSCTKEEEWLCLELPFEEPNEDLYWQGLTVAKASSRLLIGKDVACYITYIDGEQQIEQEVCHLENGALLYLSLKTAEGVTVQEAISYTESVPSGAYDFPAEPQDFEAMMAEIEAK